MIIIKYHIFPVIFYLIRKETTSGQTPSSGDQDTSNETPEEIGRGDQRVLDSPFRLLPHLCATIRLIHCLQKEHSATCAIAIATAGSTAPHDSPSDPDPALPTNDHNLRKKVVSHLNIGITLAKGAAAVSQRETDVAFHGFRTTVDAQAHAASAYSDHVVSSAAIDGRAEHATRRAMTTEAVDQVTDWW